MPPWVWIAGGLLSAGVLTPAPGQSRSSPERRSGVPREQGSYHSQRFGLCEDYAEADRTQAKLDRDFRCLREVGAGVLRVGISWLDVEPEPGRFNWEFWDRLVATAEANHVRLIPYVCYTPEWAASNPEYFWKQPPARTKDFQRFMALIAARYRGKIHSWELWNEPDNQDFWLGSAAQYAALVKAGAAGVHEADPQAAVVLGGLADGWGDFFETLVRHYRIESIVDVINIHGYYETWNTRPLENYPACLAHVAALARAGQSQSAPIPLWMAEFGYSSTGFPGGDQSHTLSGQAVALFKSHILALSTGRLALTAWYRIDDLRPGTSVIGDSLNWSLGILDVNGRPKPAFYALQFYGRLFGQPLRCCDKAVQVMPMPERVAAAQPVVHVFEKKDGTLLVVGWLSRSASFQDTGLAAQEVSLTLPPMPRPQITVFDSTGQPLPSRAAWSGGMLRHVGLTQSSLFIAQLIPMRPHKYPRYRKHPEYRNYR